MKALYSAQGVPLQKYEKIFFRSKISDENEIVCEPDVDEFIENYKTDFKSLYDVYTN